ncbi:efflux RND transporter periplasmic adaptor subunit [Tunturiibacter gelidoferens]|uniref:RND family efflux transporter MFP subunit n=2 Tax=Tunturiibacter TaxID=3154218 RepID=A0A7Y9NQ60_9BACT|nr:efflux RND transporter periplasmic adaptor subunit [Edaphobacter lichenicola]MBB5341516.1 RND family efflux transporter MFP subunit [Edaphobacter lichenicola]NYF53509.1 RND family efflux transporter MFP subunit [Edaphobacter lichenicola]
MVRLVAAALVMFGMSGCTSDPPPVAAASAERVRPVVASTSSASGPREIVVSGPVTVEEQLDVVALRAGVIVAMPVDVNSEVEKGQVMARLDARQLEADRATSEHKAESVDADLKNWESELQVKEADLRRAEAMHKEGISTQEAYDHSLYEVTASKYEVERQRGDELSAKDSVRSIDLELEKTRIVAPFRGVVSQRYVRQGQYVTVGEKLFRVIGRSSLEVRFTLPATEAQLLRRGDVVTVSATTDFKESTAATVTHLSPVVDPGSGTIEVVAVVKDRLRGLIPGTMASIRIAGTR